MAAKQKFTVQDHVNQQMCWIWQPLVDVFVDILNDTMGEPQSSVLFMQFILVMILATLLSLAVSPAAAGSGFCDKNKSN